MLTFNPDAETKVDALEIKIGENVHYVPLMNAMTYGELRFVTQSDDNFPEWLRMYLGDDVDRLKIDDIAHIMLEWQAQSAKETEVPPGE